jgi:hypothetical protein
VEHADVVVSAICGGAFTALLAKYVVMKALHDLTELYDKVTHINQNLAAISVHLEKLSEHDTTIKEHAKRIAYIEGAFYDDRRSQSAV